MYDERGFLLKKKLCKIIIIIILPYIKYKDYKTKCVQQNFEEIIIEEKRKMYIIFIIRLFYLYN